jgi:4-amino-4-deoxy-L-arabinose transferase-like glycosyltransferase
VFLSLSSILLIYAAGKQLSGRLVGLVAATLFAVSPDMVYNGRRSTQEALGITLVLVGVYFAARFLRQRRIWLPIAAGIALGLAMATKCTFIPAFLGVMVATAVSATSGWRNLTRFARPWFLVIYLAYAIALVGVLFLLSRVIGLPIPVAFFSGTFETSNPIAVAPTTGLFVLLPFLLAVLTSDRVSLRQCWRYILSLVRHQAVWLTGTSALAGFVAVTGYLVAKSQSAFFSQTFLMQRRGELMVSLSSFFQLLQNGIKAMEFPGIAYVPVLLSLPLALVVLNKKLLPRGAFYLSASVVAVLVFCQAMPAAPRYYVSVYPFFLLTLATLVPHGTRLPGASLNVLDQKTKASIVSVLVTFVLFVSVSLVLLFNYTGYDVGGTAFLSSDQCRQVYEQTTVYLQSVSPNKVWAVSPIFCAIDPKLPSTLNADSYALLQLGNETNGTSPKRQDA